MLKFFRIRNFLRRSNVHFISFKANRKFCLCKCITTINFTYFDVLNRYIGLCKFVCIKYTYVSVSQRNDILNVSNHINDILEATILVLDSSTFVPTC